MQNNPFILALLSLLVFVCRELFGPILQDFSRKILVPYISARSELLIKKIERVIELLFSYALPIYVIAMIFITLPNVTHFNMLAISICVGLIFSSLILELIRYQLELIRYQFETTKRHMGVTEKIMNMLYESHNAHHQLTENIITMAKNDTLIAEQVSEFSKSSAEFAKSSVKTAEMSVKIIEESAKKNANFKK